MRTWFHDLRRVFRRPAPRRPLPPCRPAVESLEDRSLPSTLFEQTNLVSDIPGMARFTDKNLLNPWGLVLSSVAPFAIADNGAGVATFHRRSGRPFTMVVTIPAPGNGTSAPTGEVFNPTADFILRGVPGGPAGPAVLLWATEDGTIAAWNPLVNPNTAMLVVNNSPGAVYKGLALGSNASGNFLFATNFRAGTIDVFDTNFKPVHPSGSFSDPNIPAGFAPFGIRNINGLLFVTYAKQDGEKHDDVAGPGNGFVDVFDTNGNLVRRLASGGVLNSPWGLVIAPSRFGRFGGALLVGNFGNGRINAFNPASGAFLGTLRDDTGRRLKIDDLWGLDSEAGSSRTVFFTAGINDEKDGLFGSLTPRG